MVQILTVCGSLRSASINSALLEAIAATAPAGMTIVRADVISRLPLFNPDLAGREPACVAEWCALVARSDGVVISSPEYAHGIPGALKNALDWLVGSGEFVGKPVAVLNAAPRSRFAYEALREVLRTMDAKIVPAASLDIAVLGSGLDADGLLTDGKMAPLIRAILPALAAAL
ncbi:NADPH-dependent FMN reductase [Kineobactrum salinum]|uniref:NAD(P)H-dependent oxidoreductase n=1 Tax=Kineobactrum salinum TaxID=2708301 RepID=A0A6C0U045_9GAMM|nr:NADPH-dependent FMN reductase [Kineobactrum salinum]QIB64959.1 NAD(P)H-dependent oxidoreductase [Kineobactrum salinum]